MSELDKLPALIDLKFCGNLLKEGDKFIEYIIARIGNLQVCYKARNCYFLFICDPSILLLIHKIINKIQIEFEDRRKAELDYLKYIWSAYLSASIPQTELINDQMQVFKTLHPRYIRLLQSEFFFSLFFF